MVLASPHLRTWLPWMGRASGLATESTWRPTPAGSPPGNWWRTWPEAARRASRRTRARGWSPSYQPLRPPKKKVRQLGSRLRRRPDPSRRRSGSLASSRHHSVGADPAPTTLPRGEVGQCAAMRAAATVCVPTEGREGRTEAASAAAGAAGESSESSPQQWKQSEWYFWRRFFTLKRKNCEILKLKSNKNENWTRERQHHWFLM